MKEQKPMGLGQLGARDTIFVRKFRWTLKSNTLSEYAISNVKFDFINKTIEFKAIEAFFNQDGQLVMSLHDWLDSDLSKETLIFNTLDGCGDMLYEYKFTGLKLLEDKQNFDYADSDVSAREIKLTYELKKRYQMLSQQTNPKCSKEGKQPDSFFQRKKEKYKLMELEKKIKEKETGEIEINFLGSKITIPVKIS